MHSTHLRKEHIHGVLLGVAIGDSLGSARHGLNRKAILRSYGRRLSVARLPGTRGYGENTRLMILNAQALLNSRSEMSLLRRAFRWRLSWYLLSLPLGARFSTLRAAARSWLLRFDVESGVPAEDAGAATRAIFSTLAINGGGHRINRWIEQSTRLTHTHPLAIASCCALASIADYGTSKPQAEFEPEAALAQAISTCSHENLRSKLEQLSHALDKRKSVKAVAANFGWADKATGLEAVTVMSIYCWLRNHDSFERALRSALCLGGDARDLGAIVGGLAGARLGQAVILDPLRNGFKASPHDAVWLEELAKRFSHWPHGMDDLHAAYAEPSRPITQVLANVASVPGRIIARIARARLWL